MCEKNYSIINKMIMYIYKRQIQQNSFNLMSGNSEILTILHLRRVVTKPGTLPFARKCFIKENGRSEGNVQAASKSVCTSTIAAAPSPSSTTPLTSSAMETPENTK
jgi:hypothetical protein